jgi:hypothetical protein
MQDLVSIIIIVIKNELINIFEYTRLLIIPAKQNI